MSQINRRQSFKLILQGLLQTAGTVVVASSAIAAQALTEETPASADLDNLEKRANEIAEARRRTPDEEGAHPISFVNGRFAKGAAGGGFKNGGFVNGGGGGGFRNGGFANGAGGGGFKNGGFANGGTHPGGFANGGFKNTGWRNY